MSEIIGVQARQILDSRGNPTLEVDVMLESGAMGRAAVPSGASTGSREAVELRDGNIKVFMGKGVQKAVKNVNSKIAAEIVGIEVTEQVLMDRLMVEMDGSTHEQCRMARTGELNGRDLIVSVMFAPNSFSVFGGVRM